MLELPSFHKAIDMLAMGGRVRGFFERDELSMISKGLSGGRELDIYTCFATGPSSLSEFD
jgi:hypothetical protein